MLQRVLIANRGEIAARIARTCRRLGVDVVMVHSEADRDAPYLREASRVVAIGPPPASLSYLNGDALIQAALDTGCDALHPGYGFLSENSDFAAAVEAAGLAFVGPRPSTIAQMGDKAEARRQMARAGVPIVPGSPQASDDPDVIARHIAEIGYPVLLKPVAGGGGKGMSVIAFGDGRDAIESAIRTARSSFADGRLLVERLIDRPRHIEVQVFGDGQGNVVHLFERECSLQRRHQKIIEEAPAANLPEELRREILAAAVKGATALRYRNAGTFEFILCPDGTFYFIEVNTRLQVEHPVTEEVTEIDLVEWQLRVAAGEPLPLSQEAIGCEGHAIECRVYAEDAEAGFRPAPGRIRKVRWPRDVRVESAVEDGSYVSAHYDPMIAKLIAHAGDRAGALRAARSAVDGTVLAGVTTNLGLLSRILTCPDVQVSTADTGFVDAHIRELLPEADDADAAVAAAAAVVWCGAGARETSSPWSTGIQGRFGDRGALDPEAPLGRVGLAIGECKISVGVKAAGHGELTLIIPDGNRVRRVRGRHQGNFAEGDLDGRPWYAVLDPHAVDLVVDGRRIRVQRMVPAQQVRHGDGATVVSEMPGLVVSVNATPGARCSKGEVLFVVEAMKFENAISAHRDGVICEVACAVGDQVKAGQVLARFNNEAPPALATQDQ